MKRIMLLIIALVVAAAVAATLLLFLPARQAKPMACDLYVKAIPDLDKDFAFISYAIWWMKDGVLQAQKAKRMEKINQIFT